MSPSLLSFSNLTLFEHQVLMFHWSTAAPRLSPALWEGSFLLRDTKPGTKGISATSHRQPWLPKHTDSLTESYGFLPLPSSAL